MKHTDFYSAHEAIERLARLELIAALNAHGGEYKMPDPVESGWPELVIVGAFKHSEGSEDLLFTRANLDKYGKLAIYGKPYRRQYEDEEQIEFIEDGHIHFILDMIPETNLVSDTRKEKRNKAALQQVKEALNRSV